MTYKNKLSNLTKQLRGRLALLLTLTLAVAVGCKIPKSKYKGETTGKMRENSNQCDPSVALKDDEVISNTKKGFFNDFKEYRKQKNEKIKDSNNISEEDKSAWTKMLKKVSINGRFKKSAEVVANNIDDIYFIRLIGLAFDAYVDGDSATLNKLYDEALALSIMTHLNKERVCLVINLLQKNRTLNVNKEPILGLLKGDTKVLIDKDSKKGLNAFIKFCAEELKM